MDHLFFKQWKHFLAAVFLCLYTAMFLASCTHPAYAEAAVVAAAVEAAAATQDVLAGSEVVQAAVASTAVKFQDALVYLVGLVAGALGALATWLVNKLFGVKGKIPLPEAQRAIIDAAIQTGIRAAADYAQDKVRGMKSYEVENLLVAQTANLVLTGAPSALAALGLDEARLKTMIRAKLEDTGVVEDLEAAGLT